MNNKKVSGKWIICSFSGKSIDNREKCAMIHVKNEKDFIAVKAERGEKNEHNEHYFQTPG